MGRKNVRGSANWRELANPRTISEEEDGSLRLRTNGSGVPRG